MAQVFETTEPDVASEIFREAYSTMRMQVRGPRPLFSVASTPVGAARLDRTVFQMGLEGAADPFSDVYILGVRSGVVEYSINGSEEAYGPGEMCFPVPLGVPWATRLEDVDSELVVLKQSLLDGAAGVEPGRAPLRLLSNRPHSASAAAQLWRTSDAVRAIVAAQPETEAHPLVMAAAARLLAASVLTAFPNTAERDATSTDRLDAHPDTLRRAITFLEANPDLDITVSDIAHAAHVSVRAIQVAFRRHLDTTPMTYLRRVRLDAARAELLAAIPGQGVTVTAVAYRWGWGRPSRFAADFRAAYGQHPHALLPPR
jgi:AraC-like DNA-binding protein